VAYICPNSIEGYLREALETLAYNPYIGITFGSVLRLTGQGRLDAWQIIDKYGSQLLTNVLAFADGNIATLASFISSKVAAFDRSQLVMLWDPIVLDLKGDGVKMKALAESNAYFDVSANGAAPKTGRGDANDGLLVVDMNGAGKINNITGCSAAQTRTSLWS